MLIFFSISNKESMQWRWAILWLWILLFILAIVIAFSDKGEARSLAWICIWISTLIDGISLLVFALKIKNNPSVQTEVIAQADQNEIAQWDVVITETTVVTQATTQPTTEIQQPNNENQA